MAKRFTYATPSCTLCTVIAVLGMITGFFMSSPLIVLTALLPTAVCSSFCTEGKFTRSLAIAVLVLLVFEIAFITANLQLDFAAGIGLTEKYRLGVEIPLADIKIVAPVIMIVMSLVLVIKTSQPHTRWLGAVLVITCVVTIHLLGPTIFSRILRLRI